MNLLSRITHRSTTPLTWEHEPKTWEPTPEGGLRVAAPANSDAFRDPTGATPVDSAPFLWLPVEGDFVARALVRPTFQSTYDSGCLMVRHNDGLWAKICYERTDFGTEAIVSVVTDGISDDANGVDLTVPEVWLQIARVGGCFGLHYALPDGQAVPTTGWHMVRYFGLDLPASTRVGIVAQCPSGPGSTIVFRHFSVEQRTVANLRAGV
ncbi:MAG TPA: DUF1349 domain-containing protein [Chloroflexi bacterium]|nr:DUF1349 domain-containing protein [Chloroflexota bacterium]